MRVLRDQRYIDMLKFGQQKGEPQSDSPSAVRKHTPQS